VTEELDNSLRQTIETYLGMRLQAIDEQLSRLQSEFNEAFERLREVSASESLDSTPVSAAIAAHLQAAREQKLSGVTAAPSTQQASQVAAIKRSVAEIEKQESHADVLRELLTSAVQFAERVALFVVKNEQAIGWQACEASDATNLESIRGIAIPLTAETLLGQAARSRSSWTGGLESNAEDRRLIDQLGGEAKSLAAVPLIVRGKAVAILYADAASADAAAINVDALELLCRVAAMAINLVSSAVPAPAKQVSEPAAAPAPEVLTPTAAAVQPSETEIVSEPEPLYKPQVEPATHEVVAQPIVEEDVAEPAVEETVAEPVAEVGSEFKVAETLAQPVVEPTAQPTVEEAKAEPQDKPAQEQTAQVEAESTSTPVETEPQPPAPVTPSFTANYATPLGTARRYGVTEPDLPIDVGDEERRLHNDARRFARLLVSEIKLYNEQKVKDGRSESNIYDRLREDIDRSRQMYDKRVAPPVAARHDYFHQELVNTLAEGDTAKLGASYPGASVAVT
jgi:hypothetical protein